MARHSGLRWALFVALAAPGCRDATDEEARRAWLQDSLLLDNYDLLLRSPELVAGKFAKMASTPFAFLRGTVGQYYRDVREGAFEVLVTSFGSGRASRVLLPGDPHLENFGTYHRPDGTMPIEINDLDAARYGPFHLDLWRLGVGYDVVLRMAGIDDRAPVIRAAVRGYLDALDGDAKIEGAFVDALVARARADGQAAEELTEYTVVDAGARRLRRFVAQVSGDPAIVGEELSEPDVDEDRLVRRLLAAYPDTLCCEVPASAVAVKDLVRHVGTGVSSYPQLRYYALVEGPTANVDDDWILEVKEIRDAPFLAGLPLFPARRFDNNAERVVEAQRRLHVAPDTDVLLGWAADGAMGFRVRHRTKFQSGFDVGDVVEALDNGDATLEDVEALARATGAVLAVTHTRAPTLDGSDAREAIRAAIGDRQEALVDEVVNVATVYGERVATDHALLQVLLESEGPWLGYR